MPHTFLTILVAAAVAAPAAAADPRDGPRLELRATPRFAFSPAFVSVTAELVGGEELEAFHCPELEWDWDDGSRSVHLSDCPPFEDEPVLERRFRARHAYRSPGTYTVRLTLRRVDRAVAAASATVKLR